MSEALDPARWRLLRPLLDEALALAPAERAAFLATVSQDHADLHPDLLRLIAHDDDDSRLSAPAAEMVISKLNLRTDLDPTVASQYLHKRVGPYALRRLIGRGGMGMVYEAHRVEGGFEQRVAIKLIAGVQPGLLPRFARERQIVAQLRHRNIPQLLDGGQTEDGVPYFVLEYIDGSTLLDYASTCQANLDGSLDLLLQVADALAYAHRQNVLHRDIKPSNILVSEDGVVHLLDFGIAKLLDDTDQLTLTKQAIGPMTPEFAAPEQFRGEALSVATDVYQFGVLMFHLLCGRSPYRAVSTDAFAFAQAVCELPPLSLLSVATTNDPIGATDQRSFKQRRQDLDRVLARCLNKLPSQRYASMTELITDLRAVRAQQIPVARSHFERRRRGLLVLGTVAAAAVAAGVLQLPFDRLRSRNPWLQRPALMGLGLDRTHLHAARSETEELFERALLTEARGDLPSATALLESIHEADAKTPVAAMMLGYWTAANTGEKGAVKWLERAELRLQPLDDPYLKLLLNLMKSDRANDYHSALRYSAAILELKPKAWFLHLARSTFFNALKLPEAALGELKKINVTELDHRKLVDAIADRASYGDLPGAKAILAQLTTPMDDPQRSMLQARLLFTQGDLRGARDGFAQAVGNAQASGRLGLEGRALLYQGIFSGCLGEFDVALAPLRNARLRLSANKQLSYAIDAALALAQIAALSGSSGDKAVVAREIESAQALSRELGSEDGQLFVALFRARLLGTAPPAVGEASTATGALLEARAALARGDTARARLFVQWAGEQGIAQTAFLEEFALLCLALKEPLPALGPIDPPFGPYARFAARWALGLGLSVLPPAVGSAGPRVTAGAGNT